MSRYDWLCSIGFAFALGVFAGYAWRMLQGW
jgi:hypothetical protein